MLIPVLSSSAGLCLSAELWQATKLQRFSYELAALLMRPGLSVLQRYSSLLDFVACPGVLVLNASMPTALNDKGEYRLCSPYDGQRHSYTPETIFALIQQWKPSEVILAQGMVSKEPSLLLALDVAIFPFIPVADADPLSDLQREHGWYLVYDKTKQSFDDFIADLNRYTEKSCYVAGHFDGPALHVLQAMGINYIESDRPAADAYQGIVYDAQGDFSIEDSCWEHCFTPLATDCTCITCEQKMTRAYFHHLFAQTPLLAQRYMILHNLSYCQRRMQQ